MTDDSDPIGDEEVQSLLQEAGIDPAKEIARAMALVDETETRERGTGGAMTNFDTAPNFYCPRCATKNRVAAHHEYRIDDEFRCEYADCRALLRLDDEELIRRWRWVVVDDVATKEPAQ